MAIVGALTPNVAAAAIKTYNVGATPVGWRAPSTVRWTRRARSPSSRRRSSACPPGIVVGPDAQRWFSDAQLGRITRFDLASSFFDTVLGSLPGAYSRLDPATPTQMVGAPDQAVWILQLAPGRVGRMTADGAVSYYWLPGATPCAIIGADDRGLRETRRVGTSEGGAHVEEL